MKQHIKRLSVLKETCLELCSLACLEDNKNGEVKVEMINPYQTYSSPSTGCSYSFSSAHLATWEGGQEED